MRLAIAVVYLAADCDDERLLDVHLRQIEKNTPEPYLIYAVAIRPPAHLRHMLEQRHDVKLFTLPATELRGGDENAFYLESLIAAAVADGATHICTMHMDSFPIRPSWASMLAARLEDRCVLAGLLRDPRLDCKPLTAFLLFTRGFYLTYHPALRVSPEEQKSAAYRHYADEFPHLPDTGTGYGYTIFREGLSWHPLVRTDRGGQGWGFGVFGDMIFHLGGAQWFPDASPPGPLARAMQRQWDALRQVLPDGLRERVAALAPRAIQIRAEASRLARRKAALVGSPETFLRKLGVESGV